MPDSQNRTTENELAEHVIAVLKARPGGESSIAGLVSAIRRLGVLTPEDMEPSTTRMGEAMWEQRVRNIRSHKAAENNYIFRGYLAAIPNGYRLTPAGRAK